MYSLAETRSSVDVGRVLDQPPTGSRETTRTERIIRCKALLIAFAFAAVSYSDAQADTSPRLPTRIAETVVATWRCQDQLAVTRTEVRYSPWGHHSTAFRRYQLNLWELRRQTCIRRLHAHDATIRRLQRGLAGTPMAGTARELEAAGRRYRVHPAFIAAIAGTESSFGFAACHSNRFNAFGLSSCGAGWRVPNFQSWGEAYEFMGRFLSSRWPAARTTYDYHGYAANSDSWGRKCAYYMQARFGYGSGVRYS